MIPLTNLLPKIFPGLSCALFSGDKKRKNHEVVME